jgi:hypothetical protein
MQIVSTPHNKRKQDALEDLMLHKAELKQQIWAQQNHISISTKKLMSPTVFLNFVLASIGKKVNVYDGVSSGLKMIKIIRDLFKR